MVGVMIVDCWNRWEQATDRLDEATREVEGVMCGSVRAQKQAESRYVALRRSWEHWRKKCEKTLKNSQILCIRDLFML